MIKGFLFYSTAIILISKDFLFQISSAPWEVLAVAEVAVVLAPAAAVEAAVAAE